MMPNGEIFQIDALLPAEIAEKAENIGVKKANMKFLPMFTLAVLAGAFISLGAVFATMVASGANGFLPYGITRLLVGLVFCLGLILVIVAGAELFTGNNLIVMAWASKKVSTYALLRNWGIVYAGNFVGAVATAILIFFTRQYRMGGGVVGETVIQIANGKVNLELVQMIALGMMCNALVCLAVWMTMSARSTTDKIMAIIFPITAFVAGGFEHSIANMYFIPIGLLIKWLDPEFIASHALDASTATLTVGGLFTNLIPVTIGNIIGGGVMVAITYWLIYRKDVQ